MQKKPIACIPSSAWIQYVHRWNGNGTDAKDATNTEKHGISFAEALQVFTDTDGIEKEDLAHSSRTEQRLWRTGKMKSGRIITVVYTLSGDGLRLISAQERRRERREYEKAKKEKSD